MAVQYIDNLNYRGKKGNFERDQFATLADMKDYPEDDIDEGHLAVCLANGERYEWKSANDENDTTGRWRLYKAGASYVVLTQDEYDALTTKDESTIYFIKG